MAESYLRTLQREHQVWAERNFGASADGRRSILGVFEEVGELADLDPDNINNVYSSLGKLAHAQLKGEQGIRHTPDEIRQMKMDAIGDTVIFLADYCTCEGFDLQDCVNLAWNTVKQRDWRANKLTGVAKDVGSDE